MTLDAFRALTEAVACPDENAAPTRASCGELLRIRLLTSKKVALIAAVHARADDGLDRARVEFFRKVAGQLLGARVTKPPAIDGDEQMQNGLQSKE